MITLFCYGTLCHQPLMETVLGRAIKGRPATLPGHAVNWVQDREFPMIRAVPGAAAEGVLFDGLDTEDMARLDYYEGGFAYLTQDLAVTPLDGGGAVTARVYLPQPGLWSPGPVWRLADWAARWGETVCTAAAEIMALYGQRPAAEVVARYPMILARAASRLRAQSGGPATLRRQARAGDVEIDTITTPYANFFSMEEYELRFRRFDGGYSPSVNRATFVEGDAVIVLPYDPVRDRVMLVEQFRPGAYARGDSQPWKLEPVAGRIDAGETPEEAGRREAEEEARLQLRDMLPVAHYYPSPGGSTGYYYSYVALADLPDDAAGVGGVDGEAEDIRAHVIGFDRLMALVAAGEADNGALLVTAFWLAANRDRLRAGVQA